MEVLLKNLVNDVLSPESYIGKEIILHEPSQNPRFVGRITRADDTGIYAEITDEVCAEGIKAQVAMSMEMTVDKKFAKVWSQRLCGLRRYGNFINDKGEPEK